MENIDQIKAKYFDGEATETEMQELLDWIKQAPENEKELFQEKDIWDATALNNNQRQFDEEKEYQRFNTHLQSKQKIVIPNWIKVAAMLVVALVAGWFIRGEINQTPNFNSSAEIKEIVVPKGQTSQVFLADGTRIWLNSDTKMEVPATFTGKTREVSLQGEAFFDVAKDKKHPFIVKTKKQTIEVLGTSFNLRAYNGENIQTTLNEGRIKLNSEKGEVILAPNQQSILDMATGKLAVKKVNTNFYDSWKEGRYEFVNENLFEVFKLVERWYDVEISYNSSDFKDMYFSGVIRRNKSALHFLQLLDLSVSIDYKIDGDKISIKKQ